MPIARKRKALSPEPSKQTKFSPAQKTISQYGRVTKSQKTAQSAKKLRSDQQDDLATMLHNTLIEQIRPTDSSDGQTQSDLVGQSNQKQSNKRQREEDSETPQHKRFKDALLATPAETPTKGACNLFDKLVIVPSMKNLV